MTLSVPITIVIEPARAEIGSAGSRMRVAEHQVAVYQRLADELRRFSTAEINIVSVFLRDIQPQGILLLNPSTNFNSTLAECEPNAQRTLPRRIILIGADRSNVLQVLEQHRLAGAIEQHRFFQWSNQPQSDSGYGLYGLCAVAEAMEADQLGSGPFRSEHYCIFGGGRYSSLIELLVSYLETYVKITFSDNS